MGTRLLDCNVFDAALDRIISLYSAGDRVIVSDSGGKDSGVVKELALIAARMTNRLPVEVVTRDEEIMFPGTFEFQERTAARPEFSYHWMVANQPVINTFNRKSPYFWTFDPLLSPDDWVRQPPAIAYTIPEKHIQGMVTRERFPPPPGKQLVTLLGMRAHESINRKLGIHSSKGWMTGATRWGARMGRPIYDWNDGDVWKFIFDQKCDYNTAYDVMARHGVSRKSMRIAPPTLTAAGISHLKLASQAWPQWFNKVCKRLEGVRTAAYFGRHAVEPVRRQGETWEATFNRECIERAPQWIAERAAIIRESSLRTHAGHSAQPFPQNTQCPMCGLLSCWLGLCKVLYMGDPFGIKTKLPAIEPEFFRTGAGTWGGGKPTW